MSARRNRTQELKAVFSRQRQHDPAFKLRLHGGAAQDRVDRILDEFDGCGPALLDFLPLVLVACRRQYDPSKPTGSLMPGAGSANRRNQCCARQDSALAHQVFNLIIICRIRIARPV